MLRDRLTAGTVLDDGRFEVKRAIKAGGMGAVYEVADRRMGNKTYALKEMINHASDYEERQAARERFISEVQVMQTLLHPNIPRVTAQFMHGNSFYFVMEFINGRDLSQVLHDSGGGGLPASDVVGWAVQILEALHYLHALKPPIVHRDIKPSNILMRADNSVVLIDFGIARVTNPGEGLWIGTPGYAPPEQQFGKHEPRSDLYALGATMHELLTGVKPRDFDFASFKELKLETDSELETIIFKALELVPDDRFPNALAMSERLRSMSSYSFSAPTGAHQSHTFELDVAAFKEQHLDPLLRDLKARYGNECHTHNWPKNLDFLQFVLAHSTNFELQVVKDEDRERIRFLEKQGLLDARLLGEVEPADPQAGARAKQLIEAFVEIYESNKGMSGGLMF